jgi:hypothetical protein
MVFIEVSTPHILIGIIGIDPVVCYPLFLYKASCVEKFLYILSAKVPVSVKPIFAPTT